MRRNQGNLRQPVRARRAERRLFESLEDRSLLSASTFSVDTSNDSLSALDDVAAQTEVTPLASSSNTVQGYTPAQVAAAYGFNNVKFGSVVGNGAGQTIAIVDAYDDPNIASDLTTFDAKFGLPAASFTKIEQLVNGQAPQENAGWATEISLDVEWAHAMAPDAKIELIEANNDSLNDLLSAVQYASSQSGVSVVSMSWGASEFNGETSYNSDFTTPSGHTGVTFVASSGDSGAGALWPAISTNVLSVGGTTLNLSGSTYSSETAWSDSGGGKSVYQGEASYQEGVQTSGAAEDPDVAFDANPNTGVAVYDSIADDGYVGWEEVGGTSAGAPQWAALIAIADQGRVAAGENTLTNAAAAVYTLPSSDFHDVTSGSNGQYSATKGYDEVTGLGSPVANLVAQGLVGVTAAEQTYTTATLTTTTHRGGFFFGENRFEDVGADDANGLLMTGVTFNAVAASGSPANWTIGTSSTSVGGQMAATPTVGTDQLAASWLTGGTLNPSSGGLASFVVSTTDDAPTAAAALTDSATPAIASSDRSENGAGLVANRSTAHGVRTAADTIASHSVFDSTTRLLVESLDALFGGDTDWADRHRAFAGDEAMLFGQSAGQQTAGDQAEGPGVTALAVGLALTALWPEVQETDEAPRLPLSLAERRHAVRRPS